MEGERESERKKDGRGMDDTCILLLLPSRRKSTLLEGGSGNIGPDTGIWVIALPEWLWHEGRRREGRMGKALRLMDASTDRSTHSIARGWFGNHKLRTTAGNCGARFYQQISFFIKRSPERAAGQQTRTRHYIY
jgi:hypothetical protein